MMMATTVINNVQVMIIRWIWKKTENRKIYIQLSSLQANCNAYWSMFSSWFKIYTQKTI